MISEVQSCDTQGKHIDASVVIPAFRAAGFIGRAIDSALQQEEVNVEVIVVDDACPLQTGNAVEKLYGDRPEVRVLRLSTNAGPAGARNAGFRAARGEWIAVLDADDAFDQGRLARLISTARRLRADVVADNIRYFDAESGQLSEPRIKSLAAPTWVDIYGMVARARPFTGELDYGLLKPIFRASFVAEMRELYPGEIRHGEDFVFYVRLLLAGSRFLLIPEAGYHWTTRNSGASQTKVDYVRQAKDTRNLASEETFVNNRRLVNLLELRAKSLLRLSAELDFHKYLRDRQWHSILQQLTKHPSLSRILARNILRRMGFI